MEQRLFNKMTIQDYCDSRLAEVLAEIEGQDPRSFVGIDRATAVGNALERAMPSPLKPDWDGRTCDAGTPSSIERRGLQYGVRHGGFVHVPSTILTVSIPFKGDPSLWQCQPNPHSISGYPKGNASEGVLRMPFEFANSEIDGSKIQQQIESNIDRVRQVVETLNQNVSRYFGEGSRKIEWAVDRKIDEGTRITEAIAGLGLPVIERPSVRPVIERVALEQPIPDLLAQASGMGESAYNQILEHTRAMTRTIERLPGTFADFGEEDMRNLFLASLNASCRGHATGETFNGEGKTDILVRVDDQNIFVAECKIWQGVAAFNDAIVQLKGYLTWRDSKAAVIVFDRSTDPYATWQKCVAALSDRDDIVRREDNGAVHGESRWLLRVDPDRSDTVLLTIQHFAIPKKSSK